MTREEFDAAVMAEPSPLIAKYAFNIAAEVMEAIERATIDQGPQATLDAQSLWTAVYSGAHRYLIGERDKSRARRRG
jgi:hypothetical protein